MNLKALTLPKLTLTSKLSPTFATLGVPIGAILLSFLILLLVVWPRVTSAFRLRAENAQLLNRSAGLGEKAQKLASLDKVDLDSKLGAAEALLPSDKGVFSLVSQVEQVALSSGVILGKVEVAPGGISAPGALNIPPVSGIPGKSISPEVAPKIQLKVTISSDYRSFLNFLNNLLALPRVLKVSDLSIAQVSASDQSSQLKIAITIDAFWQSLPSELGSIEMPLADLTAGELQLLEQVRTSSSGITPAVSVSGGKSDPFAGF